MRNSKLESALIYLGSAFLGLGIFRETLHLPPWVDWICPGAAIITFIAVFVVRRRHKRAASAQPSSRKSRSLALRLYSLFVIVIVTLSGPWWLPYSGVHLDFALVMVMSVVTCVLTVSLYLLAWWYTTRRA
jgi:hypothetical protein